MGFGFGGMGAPDGPLNRTDRTDAYQAAHEPDPETLRAAIQMNQAGLKYSPRLPAAAYVALGLGILIAIVMVVSNW